MTNAYREALNDISEETKKCTRRATPATTANQVAFRKFVVEQSKAFRKEGLGPWEAWNNACSAWRNVKVPAPDSSPNGVACGRAVAVLWPWWQRHWPWQQKAAPTDEETANARADRAANMRDGKLADVAARKVAQDAAAPCSLLCRHLCRLTWLSKR